MIDLLVKGRVASAVDALGQRMKSIEASLQGSHWTVSQRLEVLPSEQTAITAMMAELGEARREVQEESKQRHLASLQEGRRKGAGKTKYEDSAKGKGGGKKGCKQGAKADAGKKDS